MTSAVSRPAWGRASGEFSTLIANAGRFGELPTTPVNGQVGGGGGGGGGVGDVETVGDGDALVAAAGLAALWEQPVITMAVVSARLVHRHAPLGIRRFRGTV